MRRTHAVVLCGLVSLALLACAQRGAAPRSGEVETEKAPPANSPLAKVRVGMGQREVQDLIGPPTDQKSYVTGKAFIPYYFGPDSHRVAHYYRGMGRVVFSGGSAFGQVGKVLRVEYDPNENGYAK